MTKPFASMLALSMGYVACDGTVAPLLRLTEGDRAGGGGAGAASSGGLGGENGTGSGGNPGEYLTPPVGASFQIQLSGSVDVAVDADLFIIDYSSPEPDVFAELKARSRFIGCYFSAGSYEPWRDDADAFPDSVRGEPLPNYPNEEWLDVSAEAVFDLMSARIEQARLRGCDAVYPSLVRPADSTGGFMNTEAEYAAYASRLAAAAHAAGVSAIYAGSRLQNGEESAYDAALVFGCVSGGGCDAWEEFRGAGKGVFLVEFGDEDSAASSCEGTRPDGWPLIVKTQNLSSFRHECP